MAALHNVGADAPGPVTPTSDEAPAVVSGEGFKAETADSVDCRATTYPAQSLQCELVRLAAVGAIMVAAALAFAVAVGGRP